MYKASWGQKRVCPCSKIRYYDLGKEELECPECGKLIEVTSLAKPRRGRKPGSINNVVIPASPIVNKPKSSVEDDLDIDNLDIDNVDKDIDSSDNTIEDDAVLIEEENDNVVDQAVNVDIRPDGEKEDI